jgi:hypothetical protein
MIEISVENAVSDIRKKFSKVNENQVNKAISLAINRSITSARTVAVREILKQYNIDKKFLKTKIGDKENRYNAIRVWRSTGKDQTGKILAYGRSIPLVAFPFDVNEKGITVSIKKGQTKQVPGAFMAQMKSGHLSIFARGKYKKSQFEWRNQRLRPYPLPDLPITQLMTTSVRKAIMQPVVISAMKTRVEETFPKRFNHELSRLLAQ